jgi:hypothetical protein
MFALNLNNGGEMYGAGDTLTALNLIHHTAEQPSIVIIPSDKTTSEVTTDINNDFQIYPNPTKDILYIDFPVESTTEKICILYNIYGGKVMDITGESMDISSLSTGVYYIKSTFGIKKFIKI